MKRRVSIILALAMVLFVFGCGFINQAKQKITCKTCNGNGLCWWCGGNGKGKLWGNCGTCDGSGRCKACNGIGFTLPGK